MIIVKVDGETLSSLTRIEYRIVRKKENFSVKGSFTVRLPFPKLDSMMLVNAADLKPFQLAIENKDNGQMIKVSVFDNCLLEGKNVSMDPFGVGLFGYSFNASRVREQ